MATTSILVKVVLVCYALIGLPYVALALDLRATPFANKYDSSAHLSSDLKYEPNIAAPHAQMRPVVVNSTTVVRNIPEDQQEVFCFRNFTMVGKKSEGFNVTEWETTNNHPNRAFMTPAERQATGDFNLLIIAAATLVFGIVAVEACIALAPGCGAYVGANIGAFMTAVPGGASGVAQGAIGLAATVASGAAAGARRDLIEERDTQDEEFGCYYQDGYDGTCVNMAVTQPAYKQVFSSDSNTANTPDWTCYESKDSENGEVFGYYSHCFGDNENCELQCGVGNLEVQSTINKIPEPSS